MHDIAHKDIHRGQDQPNAQAENEQHNNGIHRQQHRAQRNMGPGNQRYKEERHQAEKEVDQRKAAFFQWKNVLGDIDLAQQRAIFQHAFHRHAGGFTEEVEHQLANDQKQREILNAIPALVEQRAEHSPHDKAGQQRVEHAPGNAQHAAAVLELKIPRDEVLQQVAVFPETCKRVF